MLMTKRHIRTKSSDQHRLLLLTEVKTKEYRHSECMEKYKLHWTFFKLANKSLLQLYVFCLSTKEKEKKFAWKQMMVNDLYESRKNTSAILFWMLGTFPATLHST